MDEDLVYRDNLRLGRIEFLREHVYLRSQPRCLGLVLGNGCNIDCPHCYQSKNGDNLLRPAAIGRELRREFLALYPYLSTLRIQGGEVFAFAGFGELIEEVTAAVRRPILSVSTNGTLIDEDWAERIVRTPFRTVTVSIDAGTPATYARLRRGAELDQVLAGVRRIGRWKEKLGSELPYLDSFFVVMRSNFRELPRYFELMEEHGFSEITLQTMEVNPYNTAREPNLVRDHVIADAAEVRELYDLVRGLLPRAREHFRMVRICGMTSLFQAHGLDGAFLLEESQGLYPDSDDLAEPSLCPNPWTTLFVAENGDVHLCFLSEPIGNLYDAPLASLWNCPRALAKRSNMISGRYVASGCSAQSCSWREARQGPAESDSARLGALREEFRQLAERAAHTRASNETSADLPAIGAVRRLLASRDQQLKEMETLFQQLCERNGTIHARGQEYIAALEARLERPLVRAAAWLSGLRAK